MCKVVIYMMVFFLSLGTIQSQNKEKEIKNLEKLASNLGNDNSNYKLSYIKSKKTFILEVANKEVSKKYKFLEKDIHPEGVFFDEIKDSYTLKILSIDNGRRFIFTKFKSTGVRLSNTTNIISLDNISFKKKESLKKFIYSLRNYRKSLIREKPEDTQIFVTEPNN